MLLAAIRHERPRVLYRVQVIGTRVGRVLDDVVAVAPVRERYRDRDEHNYEPQLRHRVRNYRVSAMRFN